MNKLKTIITITAALSLCGLTAAPLTQAATYWASPTGSDTNSCAQVSGSSDPARYRTLSGGLSCLSGGDTLMLKNGTYTITTRLTNPLPSGPSPSQKTTMKGESRAGTILKRNTLGQIILFGNVPRENIRLESMTFDGRLSGRPINCSDDGLQTNFDYVDLEFIGLAQGEDPTGGSNLVVCRQAIGTLISRIISRNAGAGSPGGTGLYYRGKYGTIEYSHFLNNIHSYGVELYASGGGVDGNIVRYNSFKGNDKGLYFASGTGNVAYNNLFINNTKDGLRIRGSSNKAYNNTAAGNGRLGIQAGTSTGTNCELINNISFGNSSANIANSCSTQSNNLTTDPRFMNSAGGDYRLQAGSTAIDAGVMIWEVTHDFAGVSRPQGASYDIGAYEYTTSTQTPPNRPDNLQAQPQ